jgi:predicted Zn-ribbon and HTH transcriptional regulator
VSQTEPSEIFKASRDPQRHPRTDDGKFVRPSTCPDCGVHVGLPHEQGCDVARCPECGTQRIQCDEPGHDIDDDRAVWTGLWPGLAECRRLGWYVGGREDLNRLAFAGATGELSWDSTRQEFVQPGE